MQRRYYILMISLLVLLAGAVVGSSVVGVASIPVAELFHSSIFMQLRLPRIILCILAGAGLSVCGTAYQAIFRNPLTDPYVLGISSGASLGASLAILFGLQAYLWGVGLAALVAALGTVLLVYRIASIGNRLHTTTLLLTGVCLTFLITAVISFIMVLRQDKMDSIIFWTMGSFASASWFDVAVVAPVVVIGVVAVAFHSKDLNLLLTGSETARSLGVDVERVKKVLLFFTTLIVAFVVSSCGVIGFVGLVVPHCVRLVLGADNRRIVPASILLGALFVLLCDTMARTVLQPAELPVGSLTALVGAPLFIYLLYKNKKQY